jgi:hypothetical protein
MKQAAWVDRVVQAQVGEQPMAALAPWDKTALPALYLQ